MKFGWKAVLMAVGNGYTYRTMKKAGAFLIISWIWSQLCLGQQLLWEKKIPLSSYERFRCVVKCQDGGYLALGSSDRWRLILPQNVLSGAIIMRFDANGDTLWTRWTGRYGGFIKAIKGEDGLIYALMGYTDTLTNQGFRCIYVVTEDGVHINSIPVNPGANSTISDMEYRHGYFWLSGEKMPSLFHPSGFSFDFLLMKIRPDGSEVFSYVYNGNDPTCRGNKMEFMPNGNILFSGSVGNKIGAFEIDTVGVQIQYRTYFQNQTNNGFQEASVKQGPSSSNIVSAYRNTGSYLIIKQDSGLTNQWIVSRPGGFSTPEIFSDGSMIYFDGTYSPPTSRINRRTSDSSLVWSLDLLSPGLVQGRKGINEFYYESDSSGVGVGIIVSTSPPQTQNLYIAKFGGFGIPFDPTSAMAFEKLKTDAQPIPFPNPGSDVVRFTILAGPGKVSFTDMQGRKVLESEYLPEKGVNTKSLPAGIYNYKLERNGKVWGGKWVKE